MFISVKSGKSLRDSRQKFEDAAAERKFGVQAIHNVTATLRSKGLAFGRTLYIYEVCNPVAAKKVLDTNIKIATALPSRHHLRGREGRRARDPQANDPVENVQRAGAGSHGEGSRGGDRRNHAGSCEVGPAARGYRRMFKAGLMSSRNSIRVDSRG